MSILGGGSQGLAGELWGQIAQGFVIFLAVVSGQLFNLAPSLCFPSWELGKATLSWAAGVMEG